MAESIAGFSVKVNAEMDIIINLIMHIVRHFRQKIGLNRKIF